MSKQKVLPAALMLLANAGGILSVPATVHASTGNGSASVMPITAMFTATNEAREPARLQSFVAELIRIGPPRTGEPPEPPTQCGTVSGSGDGWDDSQSDC